VIQDEVVDVLAACPLFESLDATALRGLSESCQQRRYDRGQLIFLRGDPGDCMYVLASGSVSISVQNLDGVEAILGVLEPPRAFGELAVVDGGARAATATAREATTLVRVARPVVHRLLAEEPVVGAALLSSVVALVRHVDEQMTDLTLLHLPQRVQKFLLAEAMRHRPARSGPPAGTILLNLHLNQSDLAARVGGSRQQVNQVLVALEGTGAIERMGHRIVSVRPDLLSLPD